MTELIDKGHQNSIERKVLGAIGVDHSVYSDVSRYLKWDMFINKKYGRIFKMCGELIEDQIQINELNLTHLARKQPEYGVQMMDIVDALNYASPMDGVMYAKSVAEGWIKNQISRITQEAAHLSKREATDAFELLSELITKLEGINEGADVGNAPEELKDLLGEVTEYLQKGVDGISAGVPSGLTELDEMTNGWQDSDLTIIAARPAMGKSALATTIVKNAAHAGFPCAIFSLEMSKFQVVCRIVAEDVQLFVQDLVQRKLTSAQMLWFKESIESIRHLPITIDDNSDITIDQLRVRARELKRKKGIKLLVVDYLQLIDGDGTKGNREQEIARISRGLKKIAKELKIPVIALAQLSRAVEQRDNKRPMMSDLRESGGIEQDADAIFFLYRPEYYAKLAGEECPPEFRGVCQLITGKFRNGESSDIMLKFVGEYSSFRDRDDLNVKLN